MTYFAKLQFEERLVFSFGIPLLLRQVWPDSNIFSLLKASGMESHLLTRSDNAYQTGIKSDGDLVANKRRGDRIVVVVKMDVAILAHLADTPLKERKFFLR